MSEGTEYHNQVFLATSKDGRHFAKWGGSDGPQPIVRAAESNLASDKRRYGFGQPTVCYRDGKFILHYVDSCTWWPDTQIRLESTDPTFKDAKPTIAGLRNAFGCPTPPPVGAGGQVRRHGHLLAGRLVLSRAARLWRGSDRGVAFAVGRVLGRRPFARSIGGPSPDRVEGSPWHKLSRTTDARFLRDAHGQIIGDATHLTVFYGSGKVDGPGWTAYTWDIYRADLSFVHPLECETPKSEP